MVRGLLSNKTLIARLIQIWLVWAAFCGFSFAASPAMLVARYDGRDISGWVMSEKYDGVRGFWDGKRFISKSGKIMVAPKYFTSGLPPFAIDGELWAGRGKFEKTTSIVARAKDWSELKFMVFDVPGAKGDLFARLAVLSEFLASHPNERGKRGRRGYSSKRSRRALRERQER